MLSSSSGNNGPTYKDPLIEVKILTPMWVGGKQFGAGDRVRIAKSDVDVLKRSTPPRVEVL